MLLIAHRAMESVTLDKETMHKKDSIMPRYAELIYNGYWFSKERFKLQKIVDLKRSKVNGSVKLKLYKGNVIIQSRMTKSSAYSCLLYTSPSPRDATLSRMPSSA